MSVLLASGHFSQIPLSLSGPVHGTDETDEAEAECEGERGEGEGWVQGGDCGGEKAGG